VNNTVDPVYFHTEVADDETAQAKLFTRIDRWEKDYRALSVEAYHLNMNDAHEAHWRELIADVPPELGRNASNAELWMMDLSTTQVRIKAMSKTQMLCRLLSGKKTQFGRGKTSLAV
jgi:hypothetical protein